MKAFALCFLASLTFVTASARGNDDAPRPGAYDCAALLASRPVHGFPTNPAELRHGPGPSEYLSPAALAAFDALFVAADSRVTLAVADGDEVWPLLFKAQRETAQQWARQTVEGQRDAQQSGDTTVERRSLRRHIVYPLVGGLSVTVASLIGSFALVTTDIRAATNLALVGLAAGGMSGAYVMGAGFLYFVRALRPIDRTAIRNRVESDAQRTERLASQFRLRPFSEWIFDDLKANAAPFERVHELPGNSDWSRNYVLVYGRKENNGEPFVVVGYTVGPARAQ